MENVISNITFITDKVCEIEHSSRKPKCKVYYDFTIENITRTAFVTLPNETTLAEDREFINERVNIEIESRYPIEPVTYKERDMEGTSLTLTEVIIDGKE